MVFGLLLFVSSIASLSQASVAPAAAVAAPVLARISEDTFDPAPQYSFAYDVQDALTGDSKAHLETRNGDLVQGQYSLNDPDGYRRIVDYTADSVNGFNAVVRKAPLVAVAEPAVVESRAVLAEPLVARAIAAPLVAKAAPLKAVPAARAARLEDPDSVAVEAAPVTPVEAVPVAPAVPAAVPARLVGPASFVHVPYPAAPVFAYSRFAAPLTYAVL